ncbi:MAG: hypothetical protein QOJ79_3310 [Actinomycetota bacterium]|nr:hypothetical protein [Actinomycetota bacterium]
MKPTQMLSRYSPLVVVAIIQLVVVLLAPSTPPMSTVLGDAVAGGAAGSNGIASGGAGGTGGGVTTPGQVGGTGSSTVAGGSSSTVAGPGLTAGGVVGSTSSGGAVGRCPGNQPAPWNYMPPCVTFNGTNGGASMTGVTDKEIRFVWYEGVTPAAVAAIGSQAGLSFTETQLCESLTGYTKVVNKRYQLYGRHFVSLDGPGPHSGKAQGSSSCQFPYFQGDNCDSTDAACWRAQADVIAAMKPKPAFVIGNVQVQVPFLDELAKKHIPVLGQGSSDGFTEARAPYVWDWQMSMENVANFGAEYFCKKLAGRPVKWAGSEVLQSGTTPTTPPTRKIAIVHDVPVPDTFTPGAKAFMKTVKSCGGGDVAEFPFDANVNTLAQDMQTIAAKIKLGGYTTIYTYMDFIAEIPLTNDLSSENWRPELVMAGAGASDDDKLAQLMNPDSYKYSFGPSLTNFGLPPQAYDYYKAYRDAGYTDEPPLLGQNIWSYFWIAGDMFQVGGPSPTLPSIQAGMFALPVLGGTKAHPGMKFGVRGDAYLAQRDIREVWWCPTKTGPNGRAGAYTGVLNDMRFQHGQIDGTMRVFPNGVC